MDDNKRKYMSEPDENGIRYFDIRNDMPQAGQGQNVNAGAVNGAQNTESAAETGTAQQSKPNTGIPAAGRNGGGLPPNGTAGGNRGYGSGNNNGGFGKSPKFWRNVSIVLAIILAVIILVTAIRGAVWAMLGIGGGSKRDYSGANLPNSSYIATLYVEGTIQASNTDYLGRGYGYQHQWTLDTIDDLMYDDDNYGIIIFVNSPGGTIYESDELYLKIREYQDYTGRPVYAVMGGTAASGGYYISAPCDKIYANRNTWTGSIGVTIGTIVDFSQFLENYGIRTKTITSGANKAMGSSYQAMSAEEEAIWQALVNEAYDQFVGVVAEGRGMSMGEVYALADGRIYSARQAIDAGLVDELGGIDDAYYDMYEKLTESDDFGYIGSMERVDLTYEANDTNLSWLFGSILAAAEKLNAGSADSVIELAESINSHPASYMCEMLAD